MSAHSMSFSPMTTDPAILRLWRGTGDIGRVGDDGDFSFVDYQKDAPPRGSTSSPSFKWQMSFLAHPDSVDVAIPERPIS